MKNCLIALIVCLAVSSCKQKPKDPMKEVLFQAYATVYSDMTLNDYRKEDLVAFQGYIKGDTVFTELNDLVQKMIDSGTFDVSEQTGCPVDIKVSASGPSCVNGWDVSIKVTNNSEKVVKYVCFNVLGYNAVGDEVGDEYGSRCKYTGPLKPGKTDRAGIWTVYMESKMQRNKFQATGIEIDFMDGTKWPTEEKGSKVEEEFTKLFTDSYAKRDEALSLEK